MTDKPGKVIVVFGATGQQGRAFVEALSEHNASTPATSSYPYCILALSRDTSTATSTRLAKLPGVKTIQVAKDYIDDASRTFVNMNLGQGKVYGVFSVQGYVSEAVEWKQGTVTPSLERHELTFTGTVAIGIADASHAIGVKHFIYSGVDLGDVPDTGCAMFELKRRVEDHLRTLSPAMGYTFLRPTHFMDNLVSPSFMFKVSRTMVLRRTYYLNPEKKLQLIATRDIGKAGARAVVEPERWMGESVGLAGDELSAEELEKVYQSAMGTPVALTYEFIAVLVKMLTPMGGMSRFLDKHGFAVNIARTKEIVPEVEDFRTFLLRNRASQT